MNTNRFLVLILIALSCRDAHAELIFGVTIFKDLVTFDSNSPNTIIDTNAISGLTGQNAFESVRAIDFRPATGQLYALGNAPGNIYRIYTLNATTGAATQVGSDINTITGTFMGFNFNPTSDQIRIVTDSGLNLRFNPTTGALANTDTSLTFSVGDPNAGTNPNIVGAAYSNSVANATSTVLYDIDSNRDILAIQNPPNSGKLNTVGSLGVDFSNFVGFDISGASGKAFATSADPNAFSTQFYTVNLSNGTASLVGEVGSSLFINDIAVGFTAVPEPSSLGLVSIFAFSLVMRYRKRLGNPTGGVRIQP